MITLVSSQKYPLSTNLHTTVYLVNDDVHWRWLLRTNLLAQIITRILRVRLDSYGLVWRQMTRLFGGTVKICDINHNKTLCTYGAKRKSSFISVHQKPLFALYNINYQWWNINWLIRFSYHAYICTQIPTLCKTTCYEEIRIQQRSGTEKKSSHDKTPP